MAGMDCLARDGGATLRWTRAGAREYGALRPRDDADESEQGRDDERDRLLHVLRDDEHNPCPADASTSRRKARSISPRGNARTRSTGRRPDARLAADREGKKRVKVESAEREARPRRSRRLQMDWEEAEQRASAPPGSVPPPNAKPQVPERLGSAGHTHKATPKKIYPPAEVIYPPVKGVPANGSPAQPAVHTRQSKLDEQQGFAAEADEETVKHAEKFLDSIQLLADVLSRHPFLANDKAANSLTQCLAGVCVCARARVIGR